MSTRYFSNAATILLGGALAVLSMGLTSATGVAWIAFGVAIGIVTMSVAVHLDTRRGGMQRMLDVVATAVGGTLLGVSVAFGGTTVIWLVLALALGLVGLAFVGLTLHEVEAWRASHSLGDLHWLSRSTETQRKEEGKEAGPRAA